MAVLSVLLAVFAAVAFAFAAVVQQTQARSMARGEQARAPRWLPVLRVIGPLLRDPRWLAGAAVNVLGFAAQALALHLGVIAVVQAVLVLQLLFALLISANRRSLRPSPRDWTGATAVCAGIAILVALRGGVGQQVPQREDFGGYLLAIAATVATMLLGARLARRHAQTRTALVAIAAGLSFSTTAVLLVVLTHDVATSGAAGLVSWLPLGIAATGVVGELLVQDAFAGGSLPTALTATTITDPLCSAVAGAVLFDAVRPSGLQLLLGLPVVGVLIVGGVVLLATSATLHDETDPGSCAPAYRVTSGRAAPAARVGR